MKNLFFVFLLFINVSVCAQSTTSVDMFFSSGVFSNTGKPPAPVSINDAGLAGSYSKTYYGVSETSTGIPRHFGVSLFPWFTNHTRFSIGVGLQYFSFGSQVRADSMVTISSQYMPPQNAYYSRQVTKGVTWNVSQNLFQIPFRLRIKALNNEKHRLYADLSVLFYKYSRGVYPAGMNTNTNEFTGKLSTGFEVGLGYTNVFKAEKCNLLFSTGVTAFRMTKPASSVQQIQFVGVRVAAGMEWKRTE